MSGYIITATPDEALEAFEDERVRYAAHLTDGRGFIAYDGIPNGLPEGEHLLTVENFIWPWKAAPKRGVSNGFERFALVSEDMARWIMADPTTERRVTGIVPVGDEVLIETDGWAVPLAIWSAGVASVMDKRLEPVT